MSLESRAAEILDLGFDSEHFPVLKAYIELLWSANADLNLFSRKMQFDELIDNHVIDCLLPIKHFPKDVKVVADFGSGGGLPGVLYAIIYPDVTFHLYEKSAKKQDFLKRCQLLVPNIRIFGDIPSSLPGVDLVISRAFKPLDVLLRMSSNYYENGGRYFLLKGRREKIDEELALTLRQFKELKAEILELRSPVLDVERHLVLLNFSMKRS
jgi:16S rRNA (guanine527-N7)-methyltransferase